MALPDRVAAIPKLNARELVPEYLPASAWHEHGPFALWLVHALQPKMVVELGSHEGYSYFCFCQAVAASALETKCFGVDTWTGDEHAGFYSDRIFNAVNKQNQKYSRFSTLVRSTFDGAVAQFADKSIDLLHVDGRHYYDDVKHDFESWMPKLTDDAIVMFHDTQVTARGFGVKQYFQELQRTHKTFEFTHGHGLGIMAMGEPPAVLAPMFSASGANAGEWQATFGELGRGVADKWAAANPPPPQFRKKNKKFKALWVGLRRRLIGV